MITIDFLEQLQYSWTAVIEMKNGKHVTIWYTALPMSKPTIKRVVSVASDYPKHKANLNF